MKFPFATAPVGGASAVRLPQPAGSLREVNLLGQPVKKAPTAQLAARQGHRRADQARYRAQCRAAMSF